jgi:phage shock protein PspC (stress-responsive transcriptional regulator)
MNESEVQRIPAEAGGKRCPWCAESIRSEAIKCRHCGTVLDTSSARTLSQPWLRPREGRMLAGVCAGLAEQFGISVTIVRLAFALGAFFSAGIFLVVYLALWLAMPEGERLGPSALAALEDPDRFGDDLPR